MDSVKETSEDQFLNVREAAGFMKCSTSTVYRDSEHGTMPCIRKGKRLLFKRQDLVSWLETMKSGPA